MEETMMFLKTMLEGYLHAMPVWLQSVIILMGSLRLIFKPLMVLVDSIILFTPSKKDDSVLEKLKEHKAYKFLVFFIDWLSSIKLPKK